MTSHLIVGSSGGNGNVVSNQPGSSPSQALISIIHYLQSVPNPREALRQNTVPFCLALGIPVTHDEGDSLTQALEMVLQQFTGPRFFDAASLLGSERQRSPAPLGYLNAAAAAATAATMVPEHMVYAYAANMGPALLSSASSASASSLPSTENFVGYHRQLMSPSSLLQHVPPHQHSRSSSSFLSIPFTQSLLPAPHPPFTAAALQLGSLFHQGSSIPSHISTVPPVANASPSAGTTTVANNVTMSRGANTPVGLHVGSHANRGLSPQSMETCYLGSHQAGMHVLPSQSQPTQQHNSRSADQHLSQHQHSVGSNDSTPVSSVSSSDLTCNPRESSGRSDPTPLYPFLMPSSDASYTTGIPTAAQHFQQEDQSNTSSVSEHAFLSAAGNPADGSIRSNTAEYTAENSSRGGPSSTAVIHPQVTSHTLLCETPQLPPACETSATQPSTASGLLNDTAPPSSYKLSTYDGNQASGDLPSYQCPFISSAALQDLTSHEGTVDRGNQDGNCHNKENLWPRDHSIMTKHNNLTDHVPHDSVSSTSSPMDENANSQTELSESAPISCRNELPCLGASPPSAAPVGTFSSRRPSSLSSSAERGGTETSRRTRLPRSSFQQKWDDSATPTRRAPSPLVELRLDTIIEELTLEEKVRFVQALSSCSLAFLDVHTFIRDASISSSHTEKTNTRNTRVSSTDANPVSEAQTNSSTQDASEKRDELPRPQPTINQNDTDGFQLDPVFDTARHDDALDKLSQNASLKGELHESKETATPERLTRRLESVKDDMPHCRTASSHSVEEEESKSTNFKAFSKLCGSDYSAMTHANKLMLLLNHLRESTLAFFTSCPSKVFVYFAILILQDFPLFQSCFRATRPFDSCSGGPKSTPFFTKSFLRQRLFGQDKRFRRPRRERLPPDDFNCCTCCTSSESQSDSPCAPERSTRRRRRSSLRRWGSSVCSSRSPSSCCSTSARRNKKRQRPVMTRNTGGSQCSISRDAIETVSATNAASPSLSHSFMPASCTQPPGVNTLSHVHATGSEAGVANAVKGFDDSSNHLTSNVCNDGTDALFAENHLLHCIPPHLYRDIPPRCSRQTQWEESKHSASGGALGKTAAAPTTSVFGPIPKHISPKDEILLQMPEHIITKTGVILPPSDSRLYLSKVVGVVWDKIHNSWVVNYTLLGRRYFQHFPAKKYGFLEGRQLAIELRLAKDREKSLVEGTVRGGGRRAQGPRLDSGSGNPTTSLSTAGASSADASGPLKSTRQRRRQGRNDGRSAMQDDFQESLLLQHSASHSGAPNGSDQESTEPHPPPGIVPLVGCHENDSSTNVTTFESIQKHHYQSPVASCVANTIGPPLPSATMASATTLHPLPQTVGSSPLTHSSLHRPLPSTQHLQHLQHIPHVAPHSTTTDALHNGTNLHPQQLIHPLHSIPLNHPTLSTEELSPLFSAQHSVRSPYHQSQQSASSLLQPGVQMSEQLSGSNLSHETTAAGTRMKLEMHSSTSPDHQFSSSAPSLANFAAETEEATKHHSTAGSGGLDPVNTSVLPTAPTSCIRTVSASPPTSPSAHTRLIEKTEVLETSSLMSSEASARPQDLGTTQTLNTAADLGSVTGALVADLPLSSKESNPDFASRHCHQQSNGETPECISSVAQKNNTTPESSCYELPKESNSLRDSVLPSSNASVASDSASASILPSSGFVHSTVFNNGSLSDVPSTSGSSDRAGRITSVVRVSSQSVTQSCRHLPGHSSPAHPSILPQQPSTQPVNCHRLGQLHPTVDHASHSF